MRTESPELWILASDYLASSQWTLSEADRIGSAATGVAQGCSMELEQAESRSSIYSTTLFPWGEFGGLPVSDQALVSLGLQVHI